MHFSHLYPEHNSTRRMAIANWTFVSWVAYAPGTIAVNVTWIEREFSACQTHRSMYTSIFNRFPVIRAWSLKVRHFSTFFASPVYASRTLAVNVTRLERRFNAGQTRRSMYSSIFNRLRAIARYWSEIETFSYPLHLTPPLRMFQLEFQGQFWFT